jgi:mono/diheme cytochrome c family protein
MRHFLANLALYVIASLIVLGAAFFAWVRSAQLVVSDERTVVARHAPAEHGFEWAELGRDSYARNCANCHGRAGGGWDQYPGLAHTARIAAEPGGREFLVDLHLHGLASPRWRAPMPRMGHIPDAELAAVLNHVLTAFADQPVDAAGGPALFSPVEISTRRGPRLSPRQVDGRRPDVPPVPAGRR